jgi:fumarate reductase flavoprotein subunit
MANFIFPKTDISELKDHYDFVVIGSGAAGMAAAIQAHELGLSVAILEKLEVLGGNSNRASSGMNAVETFVQLENGIVDSQESFFEETLKGGGGTNNKELLQYFVTHSESAVDWLYQHNINLTDITSTGGMSKKRAHRPGDKSAVGGYLVKGLQKQLALKQIPLFSGVEVTSLIQSGNQVTGVKVKHADLGDKAITAGAVLIASGGFAKNRELLAKYAPALLSLKTTNHDGATGDGMALATAVGGALVDMEKIQIHPTAQQDTNRVFLIGEGVRGEGAILVNRAGKRFVNEMTTRDKVTAAINELNEDGATLILDQGIRDAFKAIDFYDAMKLVMHGDSLAELAATANLDAANLEATVAKWNADQAAGTDTEFGRAAGMERGITTGPYYAIHIKPAIHYTMGGVKINKLTEVLTEDDKAIAGLYAAGEVTGGLHGNNRIGGNSIAETVVFGRQAGKQAAKFVRGL